MDSERVTIIYQTNIDATDTLYSDRLYQWDYKKYNELCKKYWNNESQYFYGRSIESIEKFISDYIGLIDKTIQITYVEIQTGYDGYPIWRFDYNIKKNTNE